MTIFYQHIGERLWSRDVPRTIGTAKDGLRRFHLPDIDAHLTHLDPYEQNVLKSKLTDFAPGGLNRPGFPGDCLV